MTRNGRIPKIKWKPVKIDIDVPEFKPPTFEAKFGLSSARATLGAISKGIRDPENLLVGATRAYLNMDVVKVAGDLTGETKPLSSLSVFRELMGKFGDKWISMDPVSFYDTDMGANLSNENIDMILGLKIMLKRNSFFNTPYVFEKVTAAINGLQVLPHTAQDLSPVAIANALIVADILRPGVFFSDDVENFILGRLIDHGYRVLLFPFDFIETENEYFTKPTSAVKGAIESPEENDVPQEYARDFYSYEIMIDSLIDIFKDEPGANIEVSDVG